MMRGSRVVFMLLLASNAAFAAEPDPHADHDAHAGHEMPAPSTDAHAGHDPAPQNAGSPPAVPGHVQHGDMPLLFLKLGHFEYRGGGGLHWEGEGWYGGDAHRIWLRSQGEISDGAFENGEHEIFYGRPISPYFDLLAGLRFDVDDGPGRGWLAVGVEGLAPYFFDVSATLYASDRGRFALSTEASLDLLVTQEWILEPSFGFRVYTADDPARGIGAGLSDIETGLRLRYEITRKFAPYLGIQYERAFGETRRIRATSGEEAGEFDFVIGLRAWL